MYPFGLKHKEYYNVISSNGNSVAQKKKFQGQELEESLGYNMHEFELRHYDATLGRFVTTDPYEQFASPYVAMGNNPIVSFDPDGGYCYDANGEQIICPKDSIYDDFRDEGNDVNILPEFDLKPSSEEPTGEDALYNSDGKRLDYDQIDWSKVFANEIEQNKISRNQLQKDFLNHPIAQIMFAIATGGVGAGGTATSVSARAITIEAGENIVYHSIKNGVTQYVGITNNLARRAAQHLAKKGITISPLMKNLTRADARAVEQALIVIHKLGKKGGTLLNKINSISPKRPDYARQLQRGYELLKSVGYKH